MVNVDTRALECLVFQLSLCLLEWITPCVLQLLVAELSPCVACSISSLGLKSIVSSILRNVTNFVFINSRKELLRTVLVMIISINFLFLIYHNWNNFRFNFLNCLNFFLHLLLWSHWLSGFLILKVEFLLGIKIWRVNWSLDFLCLLFFLDFFLLLLRLWGLFRFALLLRRLLLFYFLLWLLFLLRNNDFRLLNFSWLRVIII